ncbi:MAG: polyphosphate kinase 1 [Lachnospiraceae bacterium]|nr:polyphosphate kinase 1 [Lachnospiraceae bacterium]
MLYENRELSWLKFNERVLEEAVNPRNPLCEKMSFLSIFQSNLDEFFMVRVGSLQDQGLLSQEIRDNKTNMTCEEQIDAILARVRELSIRKDEIYANIMAEVAEHGISLRSFRDLPKSKDKTLESYFMKEISPLLTAMLVGRKQPFPFLRSQEIYALAVLETKNEKKKLGIIPCTSHVFPRLIPVSSKPGVYMLSEELILRYIHKMYKGYRVIGKTLIRITRNADIDTDTVYDEDLGYRDYMAQIVKQRRKLAPIRLELTDEVEPGALATVCQYFELDESRVFFSKAPLDLSFLSQISGELRQDTSLVYPRRKPQPPRMVDAGRSMIAQILEKDILLTYPFESIRPFLNLLNEAARDPKVISIRMTLYRLAKNSKVIEALVEAVENGKQVDVLVELKARFDEENNIGWSRTLEDAGCHVVYGIDGLKVHSKLCLITRKDGPEIQYITQIGTGNYNESTAKVYTDLSLMTASSEIGEEASQIFHAILLGEVTEESEHLLVAPLCMKNRILAMMEEEIRLAKAGKPAYIGVKINSLTDKKIIDKLIDASRVGVKIDMVVRGICCLKSGIPGWTDNIRVMSIVGRFLEHSRIYIFGTPDRDRMYISSADFMTRNMLRRVEIAAPIYDEALKERLRTMFNTMLHDTVNGRIQRPDGTYVHCEPAENEYPVNSQEQFYTEAYVAAEHRQ